MSECQQFPDTWEEFEQAYGFEDKKEIYTNGSRLIQSFRVKQWLDHIAEPERKKGKWIKHENPTLGHCLQVIYECSVCHIAHGCEYFVRRSFCPNCGADMRGE